MENKPKIDSERSKPNQDEMHPIDMEETQDSGGPCPHPLEVIQNAYKSMEIGFEVMEETVVVTQITLENLQVRVVCCGEPDDLAAIMVNLPVLAAPKFRAAAGEFLHRLNYGAKRKFWEIDYNDGEIRMIGTIDTMVGPLTDDSFCGLFNFMLMTADKVFPYLTNVLSGSMRPDFAADQAEAAILAMWQDASGAEEDTDEE